MRAAASLLVPSQWVHLPPPRLPLDSCRLLKWVPTLRCSTILQSGLGPTLHGLTADNPLLTWAKPILLGAIIPGPHPVGRWLQSCGGCSLLRWAPSGCRDCNFGGVLLDLMRGVGRGGPGVGSLPTRWVGSQVGVQLLQDLLGIVSAQQEHLQSGAGLQQGQPVDAREHTCWHLMKPSGVMPLPGSSDLGLLSRCEEWNTTRRTQIESSQQRLCWAI